ncbi:MAG: mechanosensitive ion channel, partial [Cyanothece sp. SIO1E1]|nr:mechanosensitive ion channel [Cyanothece sp. SIO1E1]
MPDPTPFGYALLWDQILKWVSVLQRPAVQGQLLAIAIAILFAKLASKWVRVQFRRHFAQTSDAQRNGQKLSWPCSWQKYGTLLLQHTLTPLLCMVAISLLRLWFLQHGQVIGLLVIAFKLFWTFLLLRFCICVLHGFFPTDSINRLRQRLMDPLFFLFAIGAILSLQSDLRQLSKVVLFELFSGPITLGAIFLTTIGLYFWIVGVFFLERLLQFILTLGIHIKPGEGQAISLILRYILIFLGIVFIFGYVGFNTTAFAAITGGLSVGIGFGLREVISNFISGIWLLFEGALKPGDIVSVSGEVSEVKSLGIRAAM